MHSLEELVKKLSKSENFTTLDLIIPIEWYIKIKQILPLLWMLAGELILDSKLVVYEIEILFIFRANKDLL